MGLLVVVTGPPGAGKSTVAALLADQLDPSALVVGDAFFGFLHTGRIDPWLPGSDEQNTAVIEAAAAASGRLAGHCDVVYDGVVGPWFLPTFLARTDLSCLHYALLLPPLEVCLERVRTRANHGFTDLDAARQMWHQFHRAPVDDRHQITGQAHPEEFARDIADRMANDMLQYLG